MPSGLRGPLLAGLVGIFAALVGVSTFAAAAPSSSTTAGPTADEIPPFAIEEFSYPNAAKVLADKGILLKRGDGHIVLAECGATANQIKVLTVKDASVGRDELYCFQATAKTGYLTLELPRVFALETADHPISADLTANGETTTVEVAKDDFASVGEGTVGGARSVLVEIRVTG